ncbi:MAG: helical backbone metal receptor [Bdellovibrionota bacterium]|nr:helical backbone metal receptor [Bdellovibrionota bacterium]
MDFDQYMKRICFLLFFYALTPSQLKAKEVRIVSLDPAVTELLFRTPLAGNIVGITSYGNYPVEATSKIEKVGTYNEPKLEKIISLEPTHILVMASGRPNLIFPVSLDFKIVELKGTQLSDYLDNLKTLEEEFKIDTNELKMKWLSPKIEVRNSKKSGLILIGRTPYVLAGKSSFLSQALHHFCGFENILDSEKAWPTVPVEKLSSLSTKTVVAFSMNEGQTIMPKQLWPNSKKLEFSGDEFLRLGPRLPAAMNKVCEKLLN